ncbi:glycerophosphodiester phosphodiesterase [Oceanobacillus luteolus]|uniref:Glycerophosphodiester phosphodiesterase n=1 Tax=Oceanobacillus luteolus TaxID=1274358 RepID=A0ABW4HX40_9BACI
MKIRGVAERGYPLRFPENTLSSFQAAINLNFTHTKLEVHLTKDGIPVVFRDATIDRMTSGSGEIRHYTYPELLQFTINHDERIPTLEEVLYHNKGKIKTSRLPKSAITSVLRRKFMKSSSSRTVCRMSLSYPVTIIH